jgi:sarcosine oxidase
MATRSFDVIVVGIGAMGAAACWQLAQRGVKVLGLEQFGIAHRLGSSGGISRMIRLAYYEHPDYVPLLRRAYELWEELEAASGQRVLFKTGGVYMGREDGEVAGGALAAARIHHLVHERLTRTELAERWPMFRLPDDFIGVWEPQAGFVLSEKSIALNAKLAMEAGAEIHAHETVREIRDEGAGVRVVTSKDQYLASRVVLCGGSWTSKLLSNLGVQLVVTRQPLGWVWPSQPEMFRLGDFGVWGMEAPDGSLHYGFPALPDYPGVKIARHGRGSVVPDPDRVSRDPTPADEAEIINVIENSLPAARGPLLAMKICMYTNSPDSHFIVDRLPGRERITVACGFSGHGFKFASVMGQVLAELAVDGTSSLSVGFLGLQRFK